MLIGTLRESCWKKTVNFKSASQLLQLMKLPEERVRLYKQRQIHRYISFLIQRKFLLTRNLYYTPILHIHTSATRVVKRITKEKSVNSEMLNVRNARERDIYPQFVKVKNSSYLKRRMKMRVIVKGQFMLCQIP